MTIHALRLEQIADALADLESVFSDPHCFHSPGSPDPRPVRDRAVSLASEFVGEYLDEEIVGRLAKLVDAEDAGSPKDARRHLTVVRRKVAQRLTEWQAQIASKQQVAATHDLPGSPNWSPWGIGSYLSRVGGVTANRWTAAEVMWLEKN